jgi:hypothetical protein
MALSATEPIHTFPAVLFISGGAASATRHNVSLGGARGLAAAAKAVFRPGMDRLTATGWLRTLIQCYHFNAGTTRRYNSDTSKV